jgi:hypothetical protein
MVRDQSGSMLPVKETGGPQVAPVPVVAFAVLDAESPVPDTIVSDVDEAAASVPEMVMLGVDEVAEPVSEMLPVGVDEVDEPVSEMLLLEVKGPGLPAPEMVVLGAHEVGPPQLVPLLMGYGVGAVPDQGGGVVVADGIFWQTRS